MNIHTRDRRSFAPTTLLEVTPTMRGLIENVIEDLLLLLDEIDGDPDIEPSFGYVQPGYLDEAEPDDDAEEDDPAEHTVLERHGEGFIAVGPDDAEEDDRGEDDGTTEHDLGALGHVNQHFWSHGERTDDEGDEAEMSGIGDPDGLIEQCPRLMHNGIFAV